MYWKIMIIAHENEYLAMCEYFKKIVPGTRVSRDMMIIYSGLVNIEIYPWRGHYHWRGHRADIIYIPTELIGDIEIYTEFMTNTIDGIILPLENIKRKLGIK